MTNHNIWHREEVQRKEYGGQLSVWIENGINMVKITV